MLSLITAILHFLAALLRFLAERERGANRPRASPDDIL